MTRAIDTQSDNLAGTTGLPARGRGLEEVMHCLTVRAMAVNSRLSAGTAARSNYEVRTPTSLDAQSRICVDPFRVDDRQRLQRKPELGLIADVA